jgi:hypothetical protein
MRHLCTIFGVENINFHYFSKKVSLFLNKWHLRKYIALKNSKSHKSAETGTTTIKSQYPYGSPIVPVVVPAAINGRTQRKEKSVE